MLYLNLKKQYKTGGRVTFRLDIDATVPEGITVFFGPSGSGKTTVLRSIAGIAAPDEGKIALGGQMYFDSEAGVNLPIQWRKVGVVFQDYALFPHLTAGQNVAYGAGVSANQSKRERVRQLLALLGIEHTAVRYPRELSGGEQQRVALARALASDPAILLLDEPLSAVDAATRSRLAEEIVAVQKRSGIPFIYVTHSRAEAARVGGYMFVLREGRIVQQGKPLEVFNTPLSLAAADAVGTENVFIGTVLDHRADEGTTTIRLNGCQLETPYNPLPLGSRVAVGVRSEDIIVSRERVAQTSARNIVEGSIKAILQSAEKTELIVACGVDFKASVTAGTVKALSLEPGVKVYLLIKARACYVML